MKILYLCGFRGLLKHPVLAVLSSSSSHFPEDRHIWRYTQEVEGTALEKRQVGDPGAWVRIPLSPFIIGKKYSHDREYKNVVTGKSVVISILMRVRQLLFTEFLQKFWKRQLFL